MALGLLLMAACANAREPWPVFGPPFADTPVKTFVRLTGDAPPAHYAELDGWLAKQAPVANVDMQGGSFWLVTSFRPSGNETHWAVAFANTWYRDATLVILGDDGSRQTLDLGESGRHDLMRYHAIETTLKPGHRYAMIVGVAAPFFTSLPRIDVETWASYQQRHRNETVLTLAVLGVLVGLGFFLLFVGLWVLEPSYQLYGAQALVLAFGWGFYFGLPWGWLGWDPGRFNFTVWFIALPIVHAPFTVHFLGLRKHAPRLTRVGYGLAIVAALLVPAWLLMPSISFFCANLMVTAAVTYSTCCGLWALGHGIREARFFTLAFFAILVPGMAILPANFGLIPDVVDNSDLLTLIGCGAEAMLLAFALADSLKIVTAARERFREGMQQAIRQASVDPLTGIGNRLAFDVLTEELTRHSASEPLAGTMQVVMIDLDGLKLINDGLGHQRGDELLCRVGVGLAAMASDNVHPFRIGGDEFAVIAVGDDLSLQRLSRALVELDRSLPAAGFPNAGLSFGTSSSLPTRYRLTRAVIADLVRQADRAMYQQKSRRHELRARTSER